MDDVIAGYPVRKDTQQRSENYINYVLDNVVKNDFKPNGSLVDDNVFKTYLKKELVDESCFDGYTENEKLKKVFVKNTYEDFDALVFSSVLGTQVLDKELSEVVYGSTVVTERPSPEDAEFLQYMEEDKLQRLINEIIIKLPSVDSVVHNNIIKELRKYSTETNVIRIALVLARNHDLCKGAYSGNKNTSYTSLTLGTLALAGFHHATIKTQYNIVHGLQQDSDLPEALLQPNVNTLQGQILKEQVTVESYGGKQNKKKTTKPTKKKTPK